MVTSPALHNSDSEEVAFHKCGSRSRAARPKRWARRSFGRQREFVPVLACSASVRAWRGCSGNDPEPDRARSDSPDVWPLEAMGPLLRQPLAIDSAVKADAAL